MALGPGIGQGIGQGVDQQYSSTTTPSVEGELYPQPLVEVVSTMAHSLQPNFLAEGKGKGAFAREIGLA